MAAGESSAEKPILRAAGRQQCEVPIILKPPEVLGGFSFASRNAEHH